MPTLKEVIEAGHDEDSASKVLALCEFLGCEPSEITEESYNHYGLSRFSYGSKEYAIGVDEDCDEATKRHIEQSIWAFNACFILSQCGLPMELEDYIRSFQEKECENANDSLLALVNKCGDIDKFTKRAIGLDSRGHFLSPYDGDENEQDGFYIYRIN